MPGMFYKRGLGRPLEVPESISSVAKISKKRTKLLNSKENIFSNVPFEDFVDFRSLIRSYRELDSFSRKNNNDISVDIPSSDATTERLINEGNLKLEHHLMIDKLEILANSSETNESLVVLLESLPGSILRSEYLIEDVINFVLSLVLEINLDEQFSELNLKYQWSFNASEYLDSKIVFIQFQDVLTVYLFQILINGLKYKNSSDNTQQVINLHTTKICQEACLILKNKNVFTDEANIDNLREKVSKKISSMHSLVGKVPVSSTKGNIDQLLKMYSKDKIDPEALSSIPTDMIEMVKQNIFDFRTRALRLEKQKREQQMLIEKKKSKHNLRQMAFKLRDDEGRGARASHAMDLDDSSDEERLDENPAAKIETTDEEIEAKRNVAETNKITSLYNSRLFSVRKRDTGRKKLYDTFNEEILHEAYVGTVIPKAKQKFLDSFVLAAQDSSNTMDKNRSYYTNHSHYLSYRQKSKIDEEMLDEIDRNEQSKQQSSAAKEEQIPTSLEPVKIVFKRKTEDEMGLSAQKKDKEVLSEDLLVKLEEKVDAVIEEYLGMKEESLVKFIVDFVKLNYYLGKETDEFKSFMSELSETLDEDAEVVISEVYSFVDGSL